MHNWDSRYAERVKLLVEILPVLAGEKSFALRAVPPSTCSSTTYRVYRWTST